MIPLSPEQKELLVALVERWKYELANNLVVIEEEMPRELREDMAHAINHSIDVCNETLEWLNES